MGRRYEPERLAGRFHMRDATSATDAHEATRSRAPMKAIVQDEYGGPDVLRLEDIETPAVEPDDVLVRVLGASANMGDWHYMTGLPYLFRVAGAGLRAPKTRVRGMDVAGRVEAVGTGVTLLQPGDEVFGTCNGSFAEYATARQDKVVPRPSNLTFEQAATVPTSGCAALQGLRTGGVRPGQKVLIIGAGGAVGSFAVQIAKALGAHVTGVCSTTKMELVRSIGADEVVDYTRNDFADGTHHYDVILDTAGNRSLSHLRRGLAPRGTLVIVGGEGGGRWFGLGRQFRALALSLVVRQRLGSFIAKASREDLVVLRELIEAGKVTPVIGPTYPLSGVPEAIRHLEEGHASGKVVIAV
jgi:NADPH:quinone reductase-like Zn-dependent oxidoreductase